MMQFIRWPSWPSVLSATNSAADAFILIAAIIAGISALHTLCLDFLIPGVGRMFGYLPPSSTAPPKAGSPEAILHAPVPPRSSASPHSAAAATGTAEDDRIDEKLGTRQTRRPAASHNQHRATPGVVNQRRQDPATASNQSARPILVQPNRNSQLATAARMSLERLASAGKGLGGRSSASAKLMRWMHDHPPFGHDLTAENVNATWMSISADADLFRIKIKAHIDMARQIRAKCCDILQDGFQQLTAGSMQLADFIDTSVQAMCLEESWDLLGHFQYISIEQAQLFWIQMCVEDWRRSDEGLLCSSHVPLFGNPEALLYLLAAPGQSMRCRIMALHELAAMDQETWMRSVEELAILELLEILAELPDAKRLSEMILALLIQLAGLVEDAAPHLANQVGQLHLDTELPRS